MNEATQALIGTASSGAAAATESALPPEETLKRFSAVLSLEDDEAVFRREMVEFARAQAGARAALLLDSGPGGEPRIAVVASVPNVSTGFTTQPEMKALASAALKSATSVQSGIKIDGAPHILLGVSFETEAGKAPLLLMLLLGPARAPFVGPIFTILHLLTRAFVERHQLAETEAFRSGFLQSTLLVDLFSRASLAPTLDEAVSIVAREVRQFVNCSRVAIGLGRGARLKVEGLSGFAKVEARSHGTRLLASAMRESIGLEKVIAWPPIEESEAKIWPATDQTELIEAFAVRQMIALPLMSPEGKEIGAWIFFFKAGEPFTPRKFALMEAATPHAAALLDLVRGSKPKGIRGMVNRFWANASRYKKTALFAALVAAIVVLLVPVPHRVAASCEVQPQMMRQVAAPLDGLLEEVMVKPGDKVEKGQLLAKLDGKEIGWRHAQALADKEMALKKRDVARSTTRDVAEVQMAQLEADAAAVQVALLEYQKANLEIRSPLDGYVLSGSLERSKGVPVSMGQKLFDIGPVDTMYLEIAVPDSDIAWVKDGMDLTMRLEARPREKFNATIREIYPVSESKDSENVFICIAAIDNRENELRPGMRGKVRIESGYRSLGWVLFHKPWDFVRLHL
ncbi:MAG: efflux RND transporter periplasmic adaptor subunit [Verrucomicrobiae bacterium]|nr:efflux RND transporter periplasmic adaptor subunit [Verrucomicrobiae bacterium]